jgi:hypothetical protein
MRNVIKYVKVVEEDAVEAGGEEEEAGEGLKSFSTQIHFSFIYLSKIYVVDGDLKIQKQKLKFLMMKKMMVMKSITIMTMITTLMMAVESAVEWAVADQIVGKSLEGLTFFLLLFF